eukprot:208492-Chlamydomonas_euryale.AAC.1
MTLLAAARRAGTCDLHTAASDQRAWCGYASVTSTRMRWMTSDTSAGARTWRRQGCVCGGGC